VIGQVDAGAITNCDRELVCRQPPALPGFKLQLEFIVGLNDVAVAPIVNPQFLSALSDLRLRGPTPEPLFSPKIFVEIDHHLC
jgi:hypothetical protein